MINTSGMNEIKCRLLKCSTAAASQRCLKDIPKNLKIRAAWKTSARCGIITFVFFQLLFLVGLALVEKLYCSEPIDTN